MPRTKGMSKAELERIVGDPRAVDAALSEFEESARTLAANEDQLLGSSADRWVAGYAGKVVAEDRTLGGLLKQIDEQSLPRGQTVIRHLEKSPRKLIL